MNNKPVITFSVEVITGIEGDQVFWWVYPNPVESDIHLGWRTNSTAAVNLTLSDLNGKVMRKMVHEPESSGRAVVIMPVGDLSLSGGLYLLQVTQEGVRRTVKVVVRN